MLKEVGLTDRDKMAVLFDPATQAKMIDSFSFFKNSATLKSLQVRLFTNPQEATAWLKLD
jgi:hypothetical protein